MTYQTLPESNENAWTYYYSRYQNIEETDNTSNTGNNVEINRHNYRNRLSRSRRVNESDVDYVWLMITMIPKKKMKKVNK